MPPLNSSRIHYGNRVYKTREDVLAETSATSLAWGAPATPIHVDISPASANEESEYRTPTIGIEEAWEGFCFEAERVLADVCKKAGVCEVEEVDMTPTPGVKKFGYQMHMFIAPHGSPFKAAFEKLAKKHQLDRFVRPWRAEDEEPRKAFIFRHSQQSSRTKVGWWLTLGFVMNFE